MEVLQATADSSGNSQVVYPLLAKNTDKLDGVLAEILRRWGTNRLDFLWCNSNHLRVLTSKYTKYSAIIHLIPIFYEDA
ncbi:MAG: hypothetical protein V7K88_27830 [Nostoc sp.]